MSNTDLEPVTGELVRAGPLLPMDTAEAERAMSAYQELCGSVLEANDWIGRPGEPESFVKRSGWQKLATFYSVTTELLERRVERDDEGRPVRAYVLARATAANGRHADGDGGCGVNEPRFANARGRQKIEHDLPATAATRATNRAVSNLIGFGAVSAEEVDSDVRAGASSAAADLPDWAQDIPTEAADRVGGYLEQILAAARLEVPGQVALDVGNAVAAYCDGTFPAACARLAKLLAQATDPNVVAQANTPPPVPPVELDDWPAAGAPDVPPQEG